MCLSAGDTVCHQRNGENCPSDVRVQKETINDRLLRTASVFRNALDRAMTCYIYGRWRSMEVCFVHHRISPRANDRCALFSHILRMIYTTMPFGWTSDENSCLDSGRSLVQEHLMAEFPRRLRVCSSNSWKQLSPSGCECREKLIWWFPFKHEKLRLLSRLLLTYAFERTTSITRHECRSGLTYFPRQRLWSVRTNVTAHAILNARQPIGTGDTSELALRWERLRTRWWNPK